MITPFKGHEFKFPYFWYSRNFMNKLVWVQLGGIFAQWLDITSVQRLLGLTSGNCRHTLGIWNYASYAWRLQAIKDGSMCDLARSKGVLFLPSWEFLSRQLQGSIPCYGGYYIKPTCLYQRKENYPVVICYLQGKKNWSSIWNKHEN